MQPSPHHHAWAPGPQPQAPPDLPLFLSPLTSLSPSPLSPHRVLLAKTEKLELRDPLALL